MKRSTLVNPDTVQVIRSVNLLDILQLNYGVIISVKLRSDHMLVQGFVNA